MKWIIGILMLSLIILGGCTCDCDYEKVYTEEEVFSIVKGITDYLNNENRTKFSTNPDDYINGVK